VNLYRNGLMPTIVYSSFVWRQSNSASFLSSLVDYQPMKKRVSFLYNFTFLLETKKLLADLARWCQVSIGSRRAIGADKRRMQIGNKLMHEDDAAIFGHQSSLREACKEFTRRASLS